MLLGGRRTQQPTIDGSGEGDGWDSGWRRLMAMARRATTARRDTTMTTMATGDDDVDNDDGDGATGDEVDDDGDSNDYGNG